ncbi:MAG: DUF4139 domain-containing protein [Elusimicrobiota bacterium]|nr:DUF4139 domain-containing protein [Elusimicrobiota bacterium]
MQKIIITLLILTVGNTFTMANEDTKKKDLSITIYNQNMALVRDEREVKLKKGLNTLKFTDIAASITPTSVSFKSLTAPSKLSILEQNYEYDLVSSEKLLFKYIDSKIEVITKDDNVYEGVLSSYDSRQLVLVKNKGAVFMVNRENIRNIEFPELPQGLITKPTLVWLLSNQKSGGHDIELNYLTGNMNWHSDYVANIDANDGKISLNGWVTIKNNSGTAYENANIKLIAGDIHRAPQASGMAKGFSLQAMKKVRNAPQFKEKTFFEYHMYTLQRKSTLKNNQTKQIELFSAPEVEVKKVYTYKGANYGYYYYNNWRKQKCNKKINVNLEFKNSKENGLGIPLPKGKIRVYKEDSDKSMQFIGEDNIDHTPKNEKLNLYLGNAFDIVGERKIMNHTKVTSKVHRDSYKIELRNHKKTAVVIKVIERQWGDWSIIKTNRKYNKVDSKTIEFYVKVPAGAKRTVTYTAEYRF